MSGECPENDREGCMCRGGSLNLDILKQDVQRAYEERLDAVERYGGPRKLQMQVDVMKSWVDDLVGQNSLLVRAIEELETEATAKLLHERTKHSETYQEVPRGSESVKKDGKSKKFKELKNMNDSLLKENLAKEREIRRLNKDMHQYEQKLLDLRKEISSTKCVSPSAKRDVEVSAGICCSDRVEHGSGEARLSVMLRDEASKCQEKMRSMETKLKSADDNVFALRKVNVALSEELHALRRVCAALDEQCRASAMRAQFKDEIIREMRRQLKQAKAKIKDSEVSSKSQGDFLDFKSTNVSVCRSSRVLCVRQPGRRCAPPAIGPGAPAERPSSSAPHPDSDDRQTPRLDGSGDDVFSIRSG